MLQHYHYPYYTIPTLNENCSLYDDDDIDEIKCFHIMYELATAIALVGGFKTILQSVFKLVVDIHIKIIQTFEGPKDKSNLFHFLQIGITTVYFLSSALLYYAALIFIALKQNPKIKEAIGDTLNNKTQEQIVIVLLKISIFLSCPFFVMKNAFVETECEPTNINLSQESRGTNTNQSQEVRVVKLLIPTQHWRLVNS